MVRTCITKIAGTCALLVCMCEVSGRVKRWVALSIRFFVLCVCVCSRGERERAIEGRNEITRERSRGE